MNPEFSRRMARVMMTPMFIQMKPGERAQFVNALSECETFNDLPVVWKQKVIEAEKEK